MVINMNNTIKYLLEKEIARHIIVIYDDQSMIDMRRIDVKNGVIRFWEYGRVVDKLPLTDLGLTENEAKKFINHVALDRNMSLTNHMISGRFKTK